MTMRTGFAIVSEKAHRSYGLQLIVESQLEERIVNFQAAVVVNVAKLPKLIHKAINMRPCRANHLGQSFVTYSWDYPHRRALPSVASQKKQNAG